MHGREARYLHRRRHLENGSNINDGPRRPTLHFSAKCLAAVSNVHIPEKSGVFFIVVNDVLVAATGNRARVLGPNLEGHVTSFKSIIAGGAGHSWGRSGQEMWYEIWFWCILGFQKSSNVDISQRNCANKFLFHNPWGWSPPPLNDDSGGTRSGTRSHDEERLA